MQLLLIILTQPFEFRRKLDFCKNKIQLEFLLPFILLTLILVLGNILTYLSQPNNNHNPNNKTTLTVVGLRLSNRWEYHHHQPTHTNSKLHDRAEIEQNSENKSYWRPQNSF